MKVILISCAAIKDETVIGGRTVPAKDLYQSDLFKKAWTYANQMKAPDDKIYILSAKHHLLNPDQHIGWYNDTLNTMKVAQRQEWANVVLDQLKNEQVDLMNDQFVFLAGKNYFEKLLPALNIDNCIFPYKGCPGIGYILQFLKKELTH